MTNNSQKLQDPLNFIPDETFCSILSFLSPHSIAIASAVCRKWRKVIQSDSVIHRDIDLVYLDQHNEAENVINHLDRLSSLALDKVATLDLNLSCFYKGFQAHSKDVGFKNLFDLASVLMRSEKTLKEIAILVSKWPSPETIMQLDPGSFLLLLVKHFKSFESLDTLTLQAPFDGVSMKMMTAASKGTGPKTFALSTCAGDSNSQSDYGKYHPNLKYLMAGRTPSFANSVFIIYHLKMLLTSRRCWSILF